ncbi:MAG: thioredoxin family protein [Ruminococcus sp.]
MALFNSGKKKEEEKKAACTCGCCCATSNTGEFADNCTDSKESVISVKVLGAGCKSCHALYENVKEAVEAMGLSADVEYITDMQKIMEYGVMSMPALVVNEKAVSMGKVLKAVDIEKLLRKSGF